ncbi:hypothetical protein C9975_03015 [Thalassospira xiamenensis]|nr:hypothetical protein C9975_03015 [Thalassospira xiamenensis]
MNTAHKVKRLAKTLARVMTRSSEIEVTISGCTAFRTPGWINIPSGDFSDPDVVTMTYGYIDHELGHENHTNHEQFVSVARISPTHKHFINMVEDVRMETCVGSEFSGAKGNLRKLAALAIEKGLFAEPTSELSPLKLVQMLVLYRGRYRIIGQQCLSDYAAKAELLVRDLLGDGPTDAICQLVDSTQSARSTYHAGVIAADIIEIIKELEQDAPDDPSEESNSNDAEDNSDSEDDNQSSGNESEDSDDGEDSEQDEDAGSDADSDQSDCDDVDADDTDDAGSDAASGPQNTDEDSEDETNEGTDDASDETSEADSDDESGVDCGSETERSVQDIASEILKASDNDGLQDIHELIAKELESNAEAHHDELGDQAGAMPSPLSQVKEPVLSFSFDEGRAKAAGKRVFQKMSKVLIDKTDSLNIHRAVGKRIDARRLTGVATGNNRLFNRRQEQPDNSAAISFLVDASGSMGHTNMMSPANQIAFAMCHGLKQSGIATEVMYYSAYNADQVTGIYIAKKFDESHVKANRFFVGARHGTPTGQAMLSAIPRLDSRPENKKILFVITDGESNSADETAWSRQFAEALGIKVIPIGLNTAFVDGFKPEDFKAIQSIEELPEAINHAISAKLFA